MRKISLMMSILFDFVLVLLGVILYYHFMVRPLAPIDLNPIVYIVFPSRVLAAMVISGLFFVGGLYGLARSGFRALKTSRA